MCVLMLHVTVNNFQSCRDIATVYLLYNTTLGNLCALLNVPPVGMEPSTSRFGVRCSTLRHRAPLNLFMPQFISAYLYVKGNDDRT